ncbi:MAG: cell division protein ZapA [Oscillospiraceae bacterium]|jgi:cell division protein ZapA|nr:cell division protein ZapA [Oscillospiraceae bacterium]
MANKITVTINGTDYTLMSEDSPAYMQKVAALVDEKMNDITSTGRVSRMDAAVLVAANLADELLKQQAASENLRRQLKGYLDDASKAKAELGECKRELLKLQQRQQQKK